MALTKEHIRQSIENQLRISRFESSHLVDSIMEIIKTTLESGEDVLVSGFENSRSGKRDPGEEGTRRPAMT
jgi:integration host factor subunit alpha